MKIIEGKALSAEHDERTDTAQPTDPDPGAFNIPNHIERPASTVARIKARLRTALKTTTTT